MQKCLLKNSRSVDCWPDSRTKRGKCGWYGCPKIQGLFGEKKPTVLGSALVAFSDTKQGFTAHCAERKTKVNRKKLFNNCYFCTFYCVCVYYKFNSFNRWFFPKHSFWEIELKKQMTDQEDSINLGKIVFDNNNQERQSWICLGQTCFRSLIVFLSQLFIILLIFFGCFWRIHLSKTCEESTVSVGILCSAAGYLLPSPRLWTS